MTNEIRIRTNKGEYNPGEEIFGAVYLKIISPTAGHGVQLKFQGTEEFQYQYPDVPADEDGRYSAEKAYTKLCCSLYETPRKTPFKLGHFIFPFKVKLLTELPGTFYAHGKTDSGVTWTGRVEYILEAIVIDAADIQAFHQIVVNDQVLPRGLSQSEAVLETTAHQEVAKFVFFTETITVTARLKQNVNRSGGTLPLRLIITNPTSVTIRSLKIQVERHVTFMARKGLKVMKADERVLPTENMEHIFIQPENGSHVVSEQELFNRNKDIFKGALDNILLPLFDSHTHQNFLPTVRGCHIRCDYAVNVIVNLSNNRTFEVKLDVPVVQAEHNQKWREWVTPDWLSQCEVQNTEGLLGVPDSVLRSEHFANIPGFHPL